MNKGVGDPSFKFSARLQGPINKSSLRPYQDPIPSNTLPPALRDRTPHSDITKGTQSQQQANAVTSLDRNSDVPRAQDKNRRL